MSLSSNIVSDFSPDSKLLALLDSDGKLKIWDVKENRLTRDDFRNPHVPYTCFTWLTVCTKHVSDNETWISVLFQLTLLRLGTKE